VVCCGSFNRRIRLAFSLVSASVGLGQVGRLHSRVLCFAGMVTACLLFRLATREALVRSLSDTSGYSVFLASLAHVQHTIQVFGVCCSVPSMSAVAGSCGQLRARDRGDRKLAADSHQRKHMECQTAPMQ